MSPYTSEFLRTVEARGFIKQITHPDALDAYCAGGVPVAYVGFDATADSLHVGHLMSIMTLRRFQQAGGKPIVLIGGGTTRIGDPTDKEKSRPMLSDADIAANILGIRQAFGAYLTFGDGPTDAIMVNNADWLDRLGYIDFLREFGVHFTVNTMVKQDTVARRLAAEQPYTFLEFNYMLLQAYDFLELNRRHACALQMGGSDQWGNIVNGVELIRRIESRPAFGLTTPLITTASGAKMGKTMDGAVWLNAARRTPFEFWQFWRNTEDADVGRFLRLFTDMSLDEIARLEALQGAEVNAAKVALANATTALLHGAEAAAQAEAAARAVFADGGGTQGLPTVEFPASDLAPGLPVANAFTLAGLTASNGEARRHIRSGAVRVNDAAISDENARLTPQDLNADGVLHLTLGKKRHVLLKPV
jgi:tyrosyl-tRNA synthetase